MDVYIAIVIWKDNTEMQPFAFDNINKMFNFRDKALKDKNIKEIKCHTLTIK